MSGKAGMRRRLSKAGFKAWLSAQKGQARPAVCGDECRCILAQYIADTTGQDAVVNFGKYYIGDESGRKLPRWAGRVVEKFDRIPNKGYLGDQRITRWRNPTVRVIREELAEVLGA